MSHRTRLSGLVTRAVVSMHTHTRARDTTRVGCIIPALNGTPFTWLFWFDFVAGHFKETGFDTQPELEGAEEEHEEH